MAVKTIIGQQAPQIRMVRKQNAIKIERLTLEPISRRVHVNGTGYCRFFIGANFNAYALILVHAEQVINYFEPLYSLGIVYPS